jgi:two-component system CheB/CheR fusion protein
MDTDPEENQDLEKPSDSPQKESSSAKDVQNEPLYIVGMGASAGGLEALEEFFQNMPPDTGIEFVLVPHLDPTHKALMAELLQRATSMKVSEIEDGTKVEPNQIYVIPPNKDMTIMHGVLQLLEPTMPRGIKMPIDFFFRHLASDQGEKSIAIILSGMGTDGTLGLKAIKEKLGTVMVQDPSSAKYSGMPQSAINTNLADYVAPAHDLPDRLIKHAHQYYQLRELPPTEKKDALGALQKIFALIRDKTGNDFSLYKKSTITRRIDRRMSVHQINDINNYVRFIQENPHEIDLIFKELLIGVTSFFRDPEAFESLKKEAIPEMMKGKQPGDAIRVWVVGCSTGEEAYSIAITLNEYLSEMEQKSDFKVQIYATDLDKEAIDTARQGVYLANIAADVSPERLERFFVKDGDNYRVKKEVREPIVFAVQNALIDPPFTKLDLLSCRNLLIYLSPELQKKVLPLFHYSLNPEGILFLGPAESIGNFTDLFEAKDNKWKIFKRRDTSIARRVVTDFPISPIHYEPRIGYEGEGKRYSGSKIADDAQKFIIQQVVPPIVIINDRGDILYTTRRTGKYLEPSVGKANMNVYVMAREGLRAELSVAIRKATADRQNVTLKGLRVKTNGSDQPINLKIMPLYEPESLRGLLAVEFEDIELPVEEPKSAEKSLPSSDLMAVNQSLEKELQSTKEHLQTVVEEMETSQEELKSSNEELQSTNEELQSTNEEVITSKEELQSLNEELTTLNSELQSKNDNLIQANNDMVNILNSTQIPTIFVDNNLRIKRFTPQAIKVISLIQSDTGRPITDISGNLQYEGLADDIKQVLSDLLTRSVEIQTKDGVWYRMNIVPYRTIENIIDGVVITFVDITELKRATLSLKERTELSEGVIQTIREPLIILDGDLKIISANPSFYKVFKVSPSDTEMMFIYDLGNGQWDIPELRKLLEDILPQNTKIEDYLVEHDFPGIGRRKMLLNARRIVLEDIQRQRILLAIEDITYRDNQALTPGGGMKYEAG